MLYVLCCLLSAIITAFVFAELNYRRNRKIRAAHRVEIARVQAKWFSDGFNDGHRYAHREDEQYCQIKNPTE